MYLGRCQCQVDERGHRAASASAYTRVNYTPDVLRELTPGRGSIPGVSLGRYPTRQQYLGRYPPRPERALAGVAHAYFVLVIVAFSLTMNCVEFCIYETRWP